MRFSFYTLKEHLNTYLNPFDIWKFNTESADDLLDYLFGGFFMTPLMIIMTWGLLPLTLIISILSSIKLH